MNTITETLILSDRFFLCSVFPYDDCPFKPEAAILSTPWKVNINAHQPGVSILHQAFMHFPNFWENQTPWEHPLRHTDYRVHNCYRHIPTNINTAIHQQHWGVELKFVWLFCPVIGRFDIFWGFAFCDIFSSLKGVSGTFRCLVRFTLMTLIC